MILHHTPAVFISLLLVLASIKPVQPGALAEALPISTPGMFPEYWLPDGPVYALEPDPSNGRLYLGGDFHYVGPYAGHLLSLNLTGSPVQNMPGFPKVDGPVYTIVGDTSVGWYIGGNFTKAGDQPRQNLFHLKPTLELDPNWTPIADGPVHTIVLRGDMMYVGGAFQTINKTAGPYLAALIRSTGAPLTGWQASSDGPVHTLLYNAVNTTLYVGGSFQHMGGQAAAGLAAISPGNGGSTGWSTAIGSSQNPAVYSLGLINGGMLFYIIAGGKFSVPKQQGGTLENLAAFSSINGETLEQIAPQPDGPVHAIAVFMGVDEFRLYIGGNFTQVGSDSIAGLARLVYDPSTFQFDIDRSFHPQPAKADGKSGAVYALSGGESDLLVGGDFEQIGGLASPQLARLDTLGQPLEWSPGIQYQNGAVRAVAAAGARVLVGGDFYSHGGVRREHLAALAANGQALSTWEVHAEGGPVYALELFAGRLYFGGKFSRVTTPAASLAAPYAASVMASSGLLLDWRPAPDGPIYALAGVNTPSSGQKIALGGAFTSLLWQGQPQPHGRLALVGVTTPQADLKIPAADGTIYALKAYGPLLVVGGDFTHIGSSGLAYAVGLDTSGQRAPVGLSPTGPVRSLDVNETLVFLAEDPGPGDPPGDLYAGRLEARLWASGMPAPVSYPAVRAQFRAVAVRRSWIYAGGTSGLNMPYLPSFSFRSGSLSDWQPDLKPFTGRPGSVLALAAGSDGRLYIGGDFQMAGGLEHPYLMVFHQLGENQFLPVIQSSH